MLQTPPAHTEIPLLLDSPHSGTLFPCGFQTAATADELLTAWDAFIPELWQEATAVGGSLLQASFPRVVIDPNRGEFDIDSELLADTWPQSWGTLQPTAYSERGMGLIRRNILPGRLMYDAALAAEEIQQRLESYYRPYHRALGDRLSFLHDSYGKVWHIDCHSMKSTGNAMNIDAGAARPDIVLGDLDGSSCEPEFMKLVRQELESMGFSVACNDPYKGGYIVQRYGRPEKQMHSLQIEINRALYMDEARFEKSAGFPKLQQKLGMLCHLIADYIRSNIPAIDAPQPESS